MTLDSVSVPLAFAAGAVSFLSPCVLPPVPVYVSYLVRSSDDPSGQNTSPAAGMSNAVAFVAGVSVVFITLFYALRTLLQPIRPVILPIAGVGRASAMVRRAEKWRRKIDLASAGVLAAMGLLLLTNSLTLITELASRVLPNVAPFGL